VVRVEEPVVPQVVALLAGLTQALAPRMGTLQERTLQEVQAAQCKAPLAKVPTQEWAAMSAPPSTSTTNPGVSKSGSSLECGC
jgi:hypothetical protein